MNIFRRHLRLMVVVVVTLEDMALESVEIRFLSDGWKRGKMLFGRILGHPVEGQPPPSFGPTGPGLAFHLPLEAPLIDSAGWDAWECPSGGEGTGQPLERWRLASAPLLPVAFFARSPRSCGLQCSEGGHCLLMWRHDRSHAESSAPAIPCRRRDRRPSGL